MAGLNMREELAQATDDLTASVLRVEEALQALRLGVNAQVPLDDQGRFLSFEKAKKGWGLYVISSETDRQPLCNASRESRVRAAEVYDALLAEMFVQAEAQVSIVKDARDRTEEFVTRVLNRAPKDPSEEG